jgi:hypothetical protein
MSTISANFLSLLANRLQKTAFSCDNIAAYHVLGVQSQFTTALDALLEQVVGNGGNWGTGLDHTGCFSDPVQDEGRCNTDRKLCRELLNVQTAVRALLGAPRFTYTILVCPQIYRKPRSARAGFSVSQFLKGGVTPPPQAE